MLLDHDICSLIILERGEEERLWNVLRLIGRPDFSLGDVYKEFNLQIKDVYDELTAHKDLFKFDAGDKQMAHPLIHQVKLVAKIVPP